MELKRIDQIKNSIEETEDQISNLQVVIQGLKNTKDQADRSDEKNMLNACITKIESEILFLEDIKDSDQEVLNLNGIL